MDEKKAQDPGRTAEEVAWDEEFKESAAPGLTSDLSNLVRFAVRLPGALLSSVVPEDTARHARAAARESFLALRSLLGAIGDNIETALYEPASPSSTPTVKGPPGTWGTGRTTQPTPILGKGRRIEVSEDSPDVSGD